MGIKFEWSVYRLRDEGPGKSTGSEVARYTLRADAVAHVRREPARALEVWQDGQRASDAIQREDAAFDR